MLITIHRLFHKKVNLLIKEFNFKINKLNIFKIGGVQMRELSLWSHVVSNIFLVVPIQHVQTLRYTFSKKKLNLSI